MAAETTPPPLPVRPLGHSAHALWVVSVDACATQGRRGGNGVFPRFFALQVKYSVCVFVLFVLCLERRTGRKFQRVIVCGFTSLEFFLSQAAGIYSSILWKIWNWLQLCLTGASDLKFFSFCAFPMSFLIYAACQGLPVEADFGDEGVSVGIPQDPGGVPDTVKCQCFLLAYN